MAKGKEDQSSQSYSGKSTMAIVLIIVGSVFLLGNFGVIPSDTLGKLWPLFIIVPAIFMLFPSKK